MKNHEVQSFLKSEKTQNFKTKNQTQPIKKAKDICISVKNYMLKKIEFIKSEIIKLITCFYREKKHPQKLKYFVSFFCRINMTSSFNNLNVPDVKRDPELPIKNERLNGFAEEDTVSSNRNHEQQCCLLDNGKRYAI